MIPEIIGVFIAWLLLIQISPLLRRAMSAAVEIAYKGVLGVLFYSALAWGFVKYHVKSKINHNEKTD